MVQRLTSEVSLFQTKAVQNNVVNMNNPRGRQEKDPYARTRTSFQSWPHFSLKDFLSNIIKCSFNSGNRELVELHTSWLSIEEGRGDRVKFKFEVLNQAFGPWLRLTTSCWAAMPWTSMRKKDLRCALQSSKTFFGLWRGNTCKICSMRELSENNGFEEEQNFGRRVRTAKEQNEVSLRVLKCLLLSTLSPNSGEYN